MMLQVKDNATLDSVIVLPGIFEALRYHADIDELAGHMLGSEKWQIRQWLSSPLRRRQARAFLDRTRSDQFLHRLDVLDLNAVVLEFRLQPSIR